MDLLLGRFADAHVETLSESELDRLEELMALPDPLLFAWMTGAEPPAPDADLDFIRRIAEFHTPPTT